MSVLPPGADMSMTAALRQKRKPKHTINETISVQHTSPGKFLRLRRESRTMIPFVRKARAFSLIANFQNRR
jgi:hypothetical protein